MSSHPRCADCAFFRRVKSAPDTGPGFCHIDPRRVIRYGSSMTYELPYQQPDDFCRHFVRAGHPWWPA